MKGLKLAGAASAPLLIVLLVGAPSPADAKGPRGPNDVAGTQDVVPRIGHPGVGFGQGAKGAALGKQIDSPSVGLKPVKNSVLAVELAADTAGKKSQDTARATQSQTEAVASPNETSGAKTAPLPACF